MTVDESLKAEMSALMQARHGANHPGTHGGSGGGGPHDPGIEGRVAKVEAALSDIMVTLARIETSLAGTMTKVDAVRLEGAVGTLDAKISGLDGRVGRVEGNVATALNTAVGKAIGPVQFLAIIAGTQQRSASPQRHTPGPVINHGSHTETEQRPHTPLKLGSGQPNPPR